MYSNATFVRPLSIISLILNGDTRVVPIIAVDFSVANTTLDPINNLDSSYPLKQND